MVFPISRTLFAAHKMHPAEKDATVHMCRRLSIFPQPPAAQTVCKNWARKPKPPRPKSL